METPELKYRIVYMGMRRPFPTFRLKPRYDIQSFSENREWHEAWWTISTHYSREMAERQLSEHLRFPYEPYP